MSMTETARRLKVVVNGDPVEIPAETLAALVEKLGFGGMKIATARNGEFVPERARAATRLEAGDRIEIVSARQGG